MGISQKAIDETRAVSHANRPYWRIFVNDDGKLQPVCLQPFDEPDYDQTRFLDAYSLPGMNIPARFETEAECAKWIGDFRLLLAVLRA